MGFHIKPVYPFNALSMNAFQYHIIDYIYVNKHKYVLLYFNSLMSSEYSMIEFQSTCCYVSDDFIRFDKR